MRIAYQCNDHRTGMNRGFSESVTISLTSDVLSDITLVDGRVKTDVATSVTNIFQIKIGRLKVPACNYQYGYGNWCWDAVDVSPLSARRVFNYLMGLKGWHCEEGPDHLAKAFNERRRVNAVEWGKA